MRVKPTVGFSATVLRRKFGAGATVHNYRDKEIVFSQGDTADALFYIQSGTVKLTAVSTRRKRAIISFLQRGGFFGEACLGGQPMRIYGPRSIGASTLTRLRKEGAVPTLRRDPRFATVCVECLLSRISGAGSVVVWANNQRIEANIPSKSEPINLGGDGWYHPG